MDGGPRIGLLRRIERWIKRLANRGARAREFQQSLDTYRLYTLFRVREELLTREVEPTAASSVEVSLDACIFPNEKGQEEFNESSATNQVMELIQDTRERNHSVQLRSSSVPYGGHGVFLSGAALPGTIVALYPGTVYAPSDKKFIPGYPMISDGNSYLVSRAMDGYIVDAKVYPNQTRWDHINSWAVGQFVNHPPKGTRPNVLLCPINLWVDQWPREWLERVPWKPFRVPRREFSFWSRIHGRRESPVQIRGLALVTRGHIQNEELFLNYRLNPRSIFLPAWYHDPEPEESARRWASN